MRIAVFGRSFDPSFGEYVQEFFNSLSNHSVDVFIYKPFFDFLENSASLSPEVSGFFDDANSAPGDVDYLISIGGDGTFLESISYLENFSIPVIGLNSGRLGFLANISKEEITEAVDSILEGDFALEERSMLELSIPDNPFGKKCYALNDVTIQKKDTVMLSVDAALNGEFLSTYWTDGLIISTPTGSTAYSLSVGGPILAPGSQNFVIAPIASHNLSVRPLVISDDTEIKLEVKSRSGNFLVTIDNRSALLESKGNIILIKKAPFCLRMIKLRFNNFYSTLRNKLLWGADKRN